MLCHSSMNQKQSVWAINSGVFSRIFERRGWKDVKNHFLTKFLAPVCFFTLILSSKPHICSCFQKIGIKIELSTQSASLWTNFCGRSEFFSIRKINEKKSNFSCCSLINVTVDGGLKLDWEGNYHWKRDLWYSINEKRPLEKVSTSYGNAWSRSTVSWY